ncbi:YlzJ-like family protein [Cohnella yongneupensis]|uniref:YlzJ-like family protein n=1 Tax=Cohnella yongneupensis TaxID=425006 RepID=A0ABW0R5K2_9BACL
MMLYTTMPLELVMDGFQTEPGPFLEIEHEGMTMQVLPTAPGVGTIVRLLSAPLDRYLSPEYSPGRTIYFARQAKPVSDTEQAGLGM